MRIRKISTVVAVASAVILLLSACGQAGPLYLPDSGTKNTKTLRRQQRAKDQGNFQAPVKPDDSAAPADATPAPSGAVPQANSPTTTSPAPDVSTAPAQPPNQP